MEETRKIACLGPAGTFSESAVKNNFDESLDIVFTESIPEVFKRISSEEVQSGLIPIENSIEGTVRPSIDSLLSNDIEIFAEVTQRIELALIGKTLENIKTVVSHPQPLAQCAGFLKRELPAAAKRETSSTSAAVREIMKTENEVAIAPVAAADLYRGKVLLKNIADNENNWTRFALIGLSDKNPDVLKFLTTELAKFKTSLSFEEIRPDKPGTLVQALTEFSKRDINLLSIESRPIPGEPGLYRFFLEIEGNLETPELRESVESLKEFSSVTVFGSYPC